MADPSQIAMFRAGMANAPWVSVLGLCVTPLLFVHCTLTEDLDPNWLAEHPALGGGAGEAGDSSAAGARTEAASGTSGATEQ